MANVHRALFLLLSSAVYVIVWLPIGSSTGGTSAGMTVTVGWNPELSTAAGTRHSTCPTLSSFAVSASMLAGHTITGAVMSAHNKNKAIFMRKLLCPDLPMVFVMPQLLI